MSLLPLHPEVIEERKSYFQRIWRERFLDQVAKLPANQQQAVHELLKQAFKAGTTGAQAPRARSTRRNH